MPSALEVSNLVKSFPQANGAKFEILRIERFAVEVGRQLALEGVSGAGKTTLLHTICGIMTPDQGQVSINGVDITSLDEARRDMFRARNVGYIFQTFNLLQGSTALQNVLLSMYFAGRTGRAAEQRARELLERVGLDRRIHHFPAQLSVGEQQRVAVARALANEPKLVLADEPTASLDLAHKKAVLDLICEVCDENHTTLLCVTHDPEVSSQFDEVTRIDDFNRPHQTEEVAA